ncbi:MAG: ABC-F family ATP-binding cassette domain-containing protein [Chloroflexi bacterium]|nr:ABC-F family ATP-binding cassette domain-containing protein [Chloroflexota bacterium]
MLGTIARLEKISHFFGAQHLLADISWEIHHDARVGLVGPNGVGKSTLLKMLARQMEPTQGNVHVHKSVRVGYLQQEIIFDPARRVIDEARDASPTLAALEREMDQLAMQMADPKTYEVSRRLAYAADRHAQLIAEFEEKGGLNFDNRVRSTLRGLGFAEHEFDLPLAALSGGQKKLVGLAKLLIEQPELLLLDEPDNHLDLRGKQFLEQLIADYPGAVVIVSHDRYLLDVVADEIAELEDSRLTLYSGNYSEYAYEKNQKLASQEKAFEVQQREIRRLEFAIRRLGGWGAGQNEKFVRRARSMQKRLDKIDRVEKPLLERRTIGLTLSAASHGSNKVVEMREVTKAFEDSDGRPQVVLRDLNLVVWHGQRVGIIGPNGAGKTVLFRCLLGQEAPTRGQVVVGPSTTLGYYAQEHQTLDPESTLAQEITRGRWMNDRDMYGLLGRFLFRADDARKRVGDLSGGEKARVQMARLMLEGANCLLLDEPTNHLDIRSAEVLEAALEEYTGTIIVISHDRYFLDNVVDHIVELEEGRGETFTGNFTTYLEERRRRAEAAVAPTHGTNRAAAAGKERARRG